MLSDGRRPVAFEVGIDKRVLPRGGRLLGPDSVASAEEAKVLPVVADLIDASEAGSDPEVDMAQIAMLRRSVANADGAVIPIADLDVDVSHGRVEGAGRGVENRRIGWNAGRRRHWGF